MLFVTVRIYNKAMNAVLFDLDGTLLNTLEDLCDSVNYALRTHGYPERSLDEVRFMVGEGVRLLVERALPNGAKDKTDEVLETFRAYYDTHNEIKTRPYDGVPQAVASIAKKYKTAIVSNKYQSATEKLRRTLFPSIALAVGEDPSRRRKPAPDAVLYALQSLGADANRAVYVGDSDIDVLTARNSGLPVLGVAWGFRGRKFLEEQGADLVIDTPNELPQALETLFALKR